jgi:Mg-chelatase subunit ChlI
VCASKRLQDPLLELLWAWAFGSMVRPLYSMYKALSFTLNTRRRRMKKRKRKKGKEEEEEGEEEKEEGEEEEEEEEEETTTNNHLDCVPIVL